ncbi:hypothetical protein CNMCM5623_003757 [Aspergillus felis]|uniref:Uncharacterized protein n=1 Tax=Aspergillus felis TaxID=1287682 RepID=A0A8H6QCT0_9EURO|nr:hypothetical protein CNMCM5623_003757 [Aspergillus felis]
MPKKEIANQDFNAYMESVVHGALLRDVHGAVPVGMDAPATAPLLGHSGNVLLEDADLQQVQMKFPAALYLFITGQMNRDFKFSSFAFRFTLTLSVNLRSSPTVCTTPRNRRAASCGGRSTFSSTSLRP